MKKSKFTLQQFLLQVSQTAVKNAKNGTVPYSDIFTEEPHYITKYKKIKITSVIGTIKRIKIKVSFMKLINKNDVLKNIRTGESFLISKFEKESKYFIVYAKNRAYYDKECSKATTMKVNDRISFRGHILNP